MKLPDFPGDNWHEKITSEKFALWYFSVCIFLLVVFL